MNPYRQKLTAYLSENPLRKRSNAQDQLIDDLYFYYMENYPYTSKNTYALWKELDALIAFLPFEDRDALISAVCGLCLEQEKLAFRGGIRIATQLLLEAET